MIVSLHYYRIATLNQEKIPKQFFCFELCLVDTENKQTKLADMHNAVIPELCFKVFKLLTKGSRSFRFPKLQTQYAFQRWYIKYNTSQ